MSSGSPRCRPSAPTGLLAPRARSNLRPFAVFRRAHRPSLPGGLTRVALEEGSLIVQLIARGGSKDTWVLEDGDDADRAGPPIATPSPRALARPALTARGLDSSSNSKQPARTANRTGMLARIAHRALLARAANLAPRRVHPARAAEAVFHSELQGAIGLAPGRQLRLGRADGRCWATSMRAPRAFEALGQITLDPRATPARCSPSIERARRRRRAPCAT